MSADNLSTTIIAKYESSCNYDAMRALFSEKGKPIWEDEVKPEWLPIYKMIEFFPSPHKSMYIDERVIEFYWSDIDQTPSSLVDLIQNTGGNLLFVHSLESSDSEVDTPWSHLGHFFIYVEGKPIRLVPGNISDVLNVKEVKWKNDIDENISQIKSVITDPKSS